MLKARAGFTLSEVVVALVMTSVIGAAVTSVFITQSRFFDSQEKMSFARGVSRGATNIMMSDMRMVEQSGGVLAATGRKITLRVPYALGMVCVSGVSLTISRFPADPSMVADKGYSGYAYRDPDGDYTYVPGTTLPAVGSKANCTDAQITTFESSGGAIERLVPASAAQPGDAVLLYQNITYEFKASAVSPGRIGLWRRIETRSLDEELVAPFDTTAGFQFYVNNSATPQASPPADLTTITGFQLILDGLSERPLSDGTYQSVPSRTSVFFKNQ